MNLKTTLALLLLAGACVGGFYWFMQRSTSEAASPTLTFLETSLQPQRFRRLEIKQGDAKLVLERPEGQADWTLVPGKWPVRDKEVAQLIETIAGLRSRFAAQPLGDKPNLAEYGLDGAPLQVRLQLDSQEYTLTLGEPAGGDSNRFARPTYLRLDNHPEVVRVAPGLLATLGRPEEDYRQRRLFAFERVAKEDTPEKTTQVLANEIMVAKGKVEGKKNVEEVLFRLTKANDSWEITEPSRDRPDFAKLSSLLTALPDVWVENFVDAKGKSLAELDLDPPAYIVSVARPGSAPLKLYVGKVSSTKERKELRPSPPNPFGMPSPPKEVLVPEDYRFAKLADNELIFEIKAEKWTEQIAIPLDVLRDPQIARFKTEDVRRVEVRQGGQALILVKDKEKWRLEKPIALDADATQVNELLDKLADLKIKGKEDVITDTSKVNLDLAVIKLDLEETKGKGDAKTTTKKSLAFQLGQDAKNKTKLLVRLEGWPRVNVVEDSLLKLVERPALAYRSKRVLDLAAGDLAKIEVTRGADAYSLENVAGSWRLVAPVAAEVDASKVNPLAGDLARLEAVEFVTDHPKAEELDKTYGLAKPAMQAKLSFTDAKKPPQTLAIGNARKDKEYFARIDNGPVFVLKKELRESLERDSLSLRPLDLWQVAPDSIAEVAIQKGGSEYRLKRIDKAWKISGPFDAAVSFQAEQLAHHLADLKADKYVSHTAKNLKDYGLEEPYLRISLVSQQGKESKTRSLLVGHPTDKDSAARYAKLGDSDGIFTLGAKVLSALDHTAYDFLDRTLLNVVSEDVKRIRSTIGAPFTLEQKGKAWQVTDSPAPTFTAEEEAVKSALRPWAFLRAERIADYGPKIDWAKYGLDKAATITVTIAEDDKGAKTVEHVLALGNTLGVGGQRYARLDKQDAVAVLAPDTVRSLTFTHLDFVNHQALKFPFDAVTVLERKMPAADMELLKKEEQWWLGAKMADDETVGKLLDKLFQLKASRVAAYPAKDLKDFGLDGPTTVWTIRLNAPAGKTRQHVLKIGGPAMDADKKDVGERFAQVDDSQAVVVLSAEVSRYLLAPSLYFGDRNLASFAFADKLVVDHKGRKATFERVDGVWQLTAPIRTEAEDDELDNLIKEVKRLRADELVAEKTDLAKFGLDKTHVQWKFFSGDKEVLNLMVGNAEPGKGPRARHYARLASSDVVFLLSAPAADRLLEEYRRRKPWPSLDAAQVEKLVYQGPTPFTLTKKDGDWRLDDKVEAKVNAKAVSETLDALARLKVQRFAADAKADLKLYGLEPPAWTIDAHTSAIKRTLLIGRTEGDSRRYYAATPGNDAVFILSEEDARKIVRPLADFLDKSDKEKK